MDNKTKVKVAVIIAIVILAVIFIFMVIFVKGNRLPKNENIPVKSYKDSYSKTNNINNSIVDESNGQVEDVFDDIISIGIQNGNLVKINSNLEAKVIKKLKNNYSNFCYGDNKVYIAYNEENNSCSIVEIDLEESNYPEKNIFTTEDYGSINNIKYYAGKLYFISEKEQLIEYSISEDFFRVLSNENESNNFVIDEKNNCLYVSYSPNGENPGIYLLDFTENSFSQVIALNDLSGELLLNGNSLVIDVVELGKLYVYNIEQNSVVEIGDNNLSKTSYHVAFYDNYIFYTNGEKIDIKDDSGNSYKDDWYILDDSFIASISMISSNKLQVTKCDQDGQIAGSIIIDLINGSATQFPDTVYSELFIIE